MKNNEKKLEKTVKTPEEKKKKKKLLAILIPIISVFLVLVISVGVFVAHKFSLIDFDTEESTTIDPNKEFVQEKEDELDFGEIDDATGNDFKEILKNWATNGGIKLNNEKIINVLLIGSDASTEEPGRANITDKGNTDVMMMVSINTVDKKIKLVSFMRDSYTYMDQFDRYAKLNAACANGGPAYLVETIENDYKIEIDGYALVDFDSFKQVIDVLGGVSVDVPTHVGKFINIPSGKNVLLNGEQALMFSRVRYSDKDGDISRVARQRQVVNALIDKAKNATLTEINDVADVILANVRTNISKKSILSYAAKAVTEGWANYEITEITMPTPDTRYGYNSRSTAWIWVVDYPLAAQKLQNEIYGETNINLSEERKTAITVMGGYVSNKTTD